MKTLTNVKLFFLATWIASGTVNAQSYLGQAYSCSANGAIIGHESTISAFLPCGSQLSLGNDSADYQERTLLVANRIKQNLPALSQTLTSEIQNFLLDAEFVFENLKLPQEEISVPQSCEADRTVRALSYHIDNGACTIRQVSMVLNRSNEKKYRINSTRWSATDEKNKAILAMTHILERYFRKVTERDNNNYFSDKLQTLLAYIISDRFEKDSPVARFERIKNIGILHLLSFENSVGVKFKGDFLAPECEKKYLEPRAFYPDGKTYQGGVIYAHGLLRGPLEFKVGATLVKGESDVCVGGLSFNGSGEVKINLPEARLMQFPEVEQIYASGVNGSSLAIIGTEWKIRLVRGAPTAMLKLEPRGGIAKDSDVPQSFGVKLGDRLLRVKNEMPYPYQGEVGLHLNGNKEPTVRGFLNFGTENLGLDFRSLGLQIDVAEERLGELRPGSRIILHESGRLSGTSLVFGKKTTIKVNGKTTVYSASKNPVWVSFADTAAILILQ